MRSPAPVASSRVRVRQHLDHARPRSSTSRRRGSPRRAVLPTMTPGRRQRHRRTPSFTMGSSPTCVMVMVGLATASSARPSCTREVSRTRRAPHLRDDRASLWRPGNPHATSTREVDGAFVPKDPKRSQHGVAIHAEDRGEVHRRGELLARLRLTIGDCAPISAAT